MMITDTTVFNLETLMAGIGYTSVVATKRWAIKHGIEPVAKGRTWLFTGRTFREALEARHREKQEAAK
jgi:hypothetical protein